MDFNAIWYHGKLSREGCDLVMHPREPGKFLIRESQNTPGSYVLTLCGPWYNGMVQLENYLISTARSDKQQMQYTIDSVSYFDNITKLVDFYRRAENSVSIAHPLTKPVSRNMSFTDNFSVGQSRNNNNFSCQPAGAPLVQNFPSQQRLPSSPTFLALPSPPTSFTVHSGPPGPTQVNETRSGRHPTQANEFSGRSTPSQTSVSSGASNHSSPNGGMQPPRPVNSSNKNRQDTQPPITPRKPALLKAPEKLAQPVPQTGDLLLAALESAISTFERDGWLIDQDDLHLETARTLGGGEFGEVLRGELVKLPSLRQYAAANRRTERGTVVVAVKKLKTVEKLTEFYSEALLMTELHHANLVRLVGVVRAPSSPSTIDDRQASLAYMNILIVTEFCSQGDLVNYLRSRGRSQISNAEQLRFALEICSAMRFLETQRIVHRDLAARNVLLDDDTHCKLSDFGLARRIRRDGTAVLAGGDLFAASVDEDSSKFPVKWTAPEAIRSADYSSKSDVWSYGVLLWEIYSFGLMPYKRVQLSDVLAYIERGSRMECPNGCPQDMYELMLSCWDASPEERPTFKQLYSSLSEIDSKVRMNAHR